MQINKLHFIFNNTIKKKKKEMYYLLQDSINSIKHSNILPLLRFYIELHQRTRCLFTTISLNFLLNFQA